MLREFAGGRGAASRDVSRPTAPIDRILEDRTTGGFQVLSAHTIYRTDAPLSTWSRRVDLGGRWFRGANAPGNTPTIATLLRMPDGDDLLAVSRRDGLQRVSADSAERHFAPNQLESAIVDIWNTSIGTLFLPHGEARRLWRAADEGWTTVSICPEQLLGQNVSSSVPLRDDGEGIVSFCGPGIADGTAALVHVDVRGDLSLERTWPHRLSYSPDEFVVDSAGRLLGRSGLGHQEIHAWTGNAWRRIGTAAATDATSLIGRHGRVHVPLATPADGSVLMWDTAGGSIRRLRRAGNQQGDGLTLDQVNPAQLAMVLDAVADGDGVLVATPRGVFRYTPATARTERVRSPAGDVIRTVARDSSGRLWAAGDRVWRSPDGAGRSWQLVDLPMVSPTELKRMRPKAEGGLWLSVDDRGLVALE
jgi:hypothetical protein